MAETTKRSKPFYKSTQDTIDDVGGITKRQMTYWRAQGLFKPQMGERTKFFTKRDIDQLRLLKRLIVDLGLSVETVRQLVEGVGREWSVRAAGFNFIDLNRMQLVSQVAAFEYSLGAILHASWQPQAIERFAAQAMLVMFRSLAQQASSPEVYAAQRDRLLKRVEEMDLAARADIAQEYDLSGEFLYQTPRLYPALPGDPERHGDDIQKLINIRRDLLRGIDFEEDIEDLPF